MAGITLLQAQTMLDTYIAGETAILASQSYEISGRKLTRADLRWVQVGMETWNARVIALSNQQRGRTRSRTVVPGG